MKKKVSNIFSLPNWMIGLKAREPEGTMTPDQVANSMELCILLNDRNPELLRTCIRSLVPKVPLKHQKVLKAFIGCTDSNLLDEVQTFINQANTQLAALREVKHVEPGKQSDRASGKSVVRGTDSEWGEDWDRPSQPKPSSRGLRALRSAKRQSSES